MANSYFRFKQFTIHQDRCAFKVGTDSVILGAVADIPAEGRILDIGAGTGLISIMLAQRSSCIIHALEPDTESFSQLEENVQSCRWNNRVVLVNAGLQNYFPQHKFDLIVSNPPFFRASMKNPDERKSAARHDVTLTHKELLEGVSALIEENGLFQVIMPFAEGNLLVAEAADYDLYCNSVLKIKPLPSSEIKRLVLTFGRSKQKLAERFLTIERKSRYEFTEDYMNLTKDFYLRF